MNKDEEEMWNRLKEPDPITDEDGNEFWYNKAGELHRENDKPAIVRANGYKVWYKNGVRQKCN